MPFVRACVLKPYLMVMSHAACEAKKAYSFLKPKNTNLKAQNQEEKVILTIMIPSSLQYLFTNNNCFTHRFLNLFFL